MHGSTTASKKHGKAKVPSTKSNNVEEHSLWHSFRLHFSNSSTKRPGYVEGPWFAHPTTFSAKTVSPTHPTGENGSAKSAVKSPRNQGRAGLPCTFSAGRIERIEAPWLAEERQALETESKESLENGEEEMVSISAPVLHINAESDTASMATLTTHTAPNVFTRMAVGFPAVPIDPHDQISTPEFLEACRQMLTILELLGGRALAPVKADVLGNVGKLQRCAEADPGAGGTMQGMLLGEMQRHGLMGTGQLTQASDALLWLKRSLGFVEELLRELLETDAEPRECAGRAYKRTLQAHHNMLVRTAFQVAMYALPSRNDFIGALLLRREAADDPQRVRELLVCAEEYWRALKRLVGILDDFYAQQKLPA